MTRRDFLQHLSLAGAALAMPTNQQYPLTNAGVPVKPPQRAIYHHLGPKACKDFLCGIDLGRQTDPASIVLLERESHEQPPDTMDVRYVYQFKLKTPYTTVVDRLGEIVSDPQLLGKIQVVIDMTGVGLAVLDMIMATPGLLPELTWAVDITAGKRASQDGRLFHVPKKDLVGILQLTLQDGRLRCSEDVPRAAVLKKELLGFRQEHNRFTGYDSFQAGQPGKANDDLVVALMLACWLADKLPQSYCLDAGQGGFAPYRVGEMSDRSGWTQAGSHMLGWRGERGYR